MDSGKRIEVFYDGDCPLCLREIRMLRWLDRHQRIEFTDIANPAFRPVEWGLTMDDFMREIQGKRADGTWISGFEVFRELYGAIGLGPLVWLSRAPGLSHLLEMSYRFFAKHRLRLTGRCRNDCSAVRRKS